MIGALTAAHVTITGAGGTAIPAYLAQAGGGDRRGGVVVIHHLPGWDRATKEMTRRFAELGYDAICPNLHHRAAPGAAPDDAAAATRAAGGVPDEQLVGDVAGAAAFLRSLPLSNQSVATIGHCSGGRQSVLAACSLQFAAAIDCYGAFVLHEPPPGSAAAVSAIGDRLPALSCPLLGLFGAQDKNPSPDEVADLARVLAGLGKQFEVHLYPDAGHAFFAVDRPSYRVAAAVDGWARIEAFLGSHL